MDATSPSTGPAPASRALPPGRLVLVRHGSTAWASAGRHTGRTDVPLTPEGEEVARRAGALIDRGRLVAAFTSPLVRARRTAELAGLADARVDENLVEWDYGGYEGRTTPQIRERAGAGWSIWLDGVVPGATAGETIEQVAARAAAVLDRVRPVLAEGDVALVAHGHLLRVLATVWLGVEPRFGARLVLAPGAVSILGHEREVPAIVLWNRTESGAVG